MAGHTYIDIGTSGKLKGRIYWESSSNGSVANTSTVYAYVQAARTDAYGPTTGTWTGDVNIASNAKTFSKSKSINDGWVTLQEHTVTVRHNDDGTGTAFVGATINGPSGTTMAGVTVTGFQYVTLDTIPRGTSITSFTISKRNETSLNFNWATADNVDALYYSTDNGSHWKNANISGTNYGNFFADTNTANNSTLTPNTTYQCKIKVVRNSIETISSQVSATTNTAPTISLSSKTETSIAMTWSIDDTASKIKYSTNNGSSWSGEIDVNAKSGTYTITGLAANTTYNIKFNIKRKGPQTWYQTATNSQTTYNYPSCTSAPNFTIGNGVGLSFYNPLNRTMSIRMWSHVSQSFVTDAVNITGTSYTLTPNANTLYASIPNNTSSVYNIDVTYSGVKKTKTGGSYSINNSACIPTFSNFAYRDTASNDLITAIDNDQTIVQGVSNVNVVISSANKMVAKNSASPSKYQAVFSNLSKTITYSSSDIDTNLGTPTGSGNVTFKVTAYDTRNVPKEVSKSINIVAYSQPTINATLQRVNNFEADTKLNVRGTYTPVTISNADKNLIKTVRYRYKETGASDWGSWATATLSENTGGSYKISEITLSLDNSKQYDFQLETTDRAKVVTTTGHVGIGQPLMFLHTSGKLEVNNTVQAEVFDSTHQAGMRTDQYFNLHHKRNTVEDSWNITNYSGTSTIAIYPEAGDIVQTGQPQSSQFSGHFFHCYYPGTSQVYEHFYPKSQHGTQSTTTSTANLRVWDGTNKNTRALKFSGDGSASWDGTISASFSGNLSGNASTATKATQDSNGNNIITNYTHAGAKEGSPGLNDVGSGQPFQRSGLYSTYTSSAWWNLINVRHRNGEGDGTSYGMQMLLPLTSHTGNLRMRNQASGNWSAWEYILREKNLYYNSSGTTGTVTLSESAANFSFLVIHYIDTKSDTSRSAEVIAEPNGKRANLKIVSKSDYNTSAVSDIRINVKTVAISGTSITVGSHEVNYVPGGAKYNANEIAIVRVDGFR